MFRNMGQYTEEDIAAQGGDVFTGSIYDPGSTTPDWVKSWAATQTISESIPGISSLQIIIGGLVIMGLFIFGKKKGW